MKYFGELSKIKNQKGLTLIEVMISVTLGVIFLTSAMTFLLSGQQAYQSQDSGSRIQENARFAMDIIRESVRMAGFATQKALSTDYVYRGSCNVPGGAVQTPCSDEIDPGTDLQHTGDRLAIAMTSPNRQDCLGNDPGSSLTRFANVFWVEEVNGVSSLYCQGYNLNTDQWIAGSQPLVDGIDQMQIQYGLLDTATGNIDRYLNADDVEAIVPVGSAWANVRAVKVGLLVNAGTATDSSENDAKTLDVDTLNNRYTNFINLDGGYTKAASDFRLRRVYTGLIAINNVWTE